MQKTGEPRSDRAITADLMTRLKRHYIKPGEALPGGVFLPEVGWNGTGDRSRRCDAIYIGFTSASGRLLVGHEVKASRSDWLTELSKPGKADDWADNCHEWWLVTAPDIVREGELPAGWGHMVPGRSKTRMDVLTPARRRTKHNPSWEAVRSVMARLDTLQATERSAFERDLKTKILAEIARKEKQHERIAGDFQAREERNAVDVLKELDGLLGIKIRDSAWGDRVTPAEVRDLAELLRTHVTLRKAREALTMPYSLRAVTDVVQHANTLALALQGVLPEGLPESDGDAY